MSVITQIGIVRIDNSKFRLKILTKICLRKISKIKLWLKMLTKCKCRFKSLKYISAKYLTLNGGGKF